MSDTEKSGGNHAGETADVSGVIEVMRLCGDAEKAAGKPEINEIRRKIAEKAGIFYKEDVWETLFNLVKQGKWDSGLHDEGKGKPFRVCPGEIAVEDRRLKVQTHDPESILKGDEGPIEKMYADFLVFAKESIRNKDLFKAFVAVEPDILTVSMDPGKHKEFVSIVIPEGEKGAVFFEHTKSATERNTRNFRGDYIRSCLDWLQEKMQVQCVRGMDGDKTISRMFTGDKDQLIELLPEIIRLAASVKDLDLNLTDEENMRRAVSLFRDGAVNVGSLLSVVDRFLHGSNPDLSGDLPGQADDYTCQKDRDAYKKQASRVEDFNEFKNSRNAMYAEFRRGVDLNFKALATVTDLQFLLIDLKEDKTPSARKSKKFQELFRSLQKSVLDMGGVIDNFIFTLDYKNNKKTGQEFFKRDYVQSAYNNVYHAARLGTEGGGAQYYDGFNKMLAASKKTVENRGDIETLEELIRYFHKILLDKFSTFMRSMNDNHGLDESFCSDLSGISMIDLSSRGLDKSELFKTLKKIVTRLDHEKCIGNIKKNKYSEKKSYTIVGDKFIETALALGSHSAHVIALNNEKEKLVKLYFYQKGTHGANFRKQFLTAVLKKMGFRTGGDGHQLTGEILLDDEKKLSHCYSEVVRLLLSSNDLDLLSDKFHPYVEQYSWMFFDGITDLAYFEYPKKHDLGRWLQYHTNPDERGAAMARLYDICGHNFKDFLSELEQLDAEQFDMAIDAIRTRQSWLKESGDKEKLKESRVFGRLANKLEKIYDERFKNPPGE